MYASLYSMLRARSDFSEANNTGTAVEKIASRPDAIIFFESLIMQKKKKENHGALNNAVVEYAKSGGTVIFGCYCSSSVGPLDAKWYFPAVWNLPWETGDYARYNFKTNTAVPAVNGKDLPQGYNVKALQLTNVDAGSVVYVEDGGAQGLLAQMSRAGMMDFDPHGPSPGANGGPVIWKEYGSGRLAWLRDVNNEGETRQIPMTMCGI